MRKCITLLAALGLLLGVSSGLWATTIPLPGGAVIQLAFQNWDTGHLYGGLTDGTYNEAQLHPGTPNPAFTAPPGANPGEDGWGIFKMKGIYDLASGDTLWAPAAGAELTGIFWGLHDYQLIQNGAVQEIRSRGLQYAFYYDTTPDFKSGDPNTDRVKDGTVYEPFFKGSTWNDTDGTLIWSGKSIPGYIGSGALYAGSSIGVDPLNEFITTFNYSTHAAAGGFYGDLSPVTYLDGSAVTHTLTGVDNDQFTWFAPGDPAYPTKFQFQFTGVPATGTNWLVKSNDPIDAVVTPELSSGGLMLLGMLPVGLAWWRRRKA
jgi:hypothetical protein